MVIAASNYGIILWPIQNSQRANELKRHAKPSWILFKSTNIFDKFEWWARVCAVLYETQKKNLFKIAFQRRITSIRSQLWWNQTGFSFIQSVWLNECYLCNVNSWQNAKQKRTALYKLFSNPELESGEWIEMMDISYCEQI